MQNIPYTCLPRGRIRTTCAILMLGNDIICKYKCYVPENMFSRASVKFVLQSHVLYRSQTHVSAIILSSEDVRLTLSIMSHILEAG